MDKLTGSFELFAVLLETLRVLLVIHGSKNGDIGFPAQLVIAGMASVIAKLNVSVSCRNRRESQSC